MDTFNAYYIIIGASIIVILSYVFNLLSQKTNIPSVVLLILLGFGAKEIFHLESDQIMVVPLEILGIVGLILIVLEAALDLGLSKKKWPIIWKSGVIAIFSLVLNSVLLAGGIMYFIGNIDFTTSLIYAIPLSIVSSAIVIPSVSFLDKRKREFLIYESTISDILGITFFYLVIGNVDTVGATRIGVNVISNIGGTLVLSVVVSYLMIIFFQRIKSEVKLFLFFAVLVLLYSIGKVFHLSSLMIILVFGIILENRNLFFSGFMRKYLDNEGVTRVLADFKLLTRESAFIVRTFFFFIFGMSFTIAAVFKPNVLLITAFFLIVMFGVRWVLFRIIVRFDYMTQVLISPRGLISILLFFAIPEEFMINDFESGILLLTIMGTSIIMTFALINNKLSKQDRLRGYVKILHTIQKGKTVFSTSDNE